MKEQKIYFRVCSAFRNAVVQVQAGEYVKRLKKLAVAPGEMENVLLPAGVLGSAKEVRIDVLRAEE